LSTSRLNTPTGGPSIESNAMVGPVGPEVVSEALDEVVSLQPAAHNAKSAAATPRHSLRAGARSRDARTTRYTTLRPGAGGQAAWFSSPLASFG
jgi:hypothetical protein